MRATCKHDRLEQEEADSIPQDIGLGHIVHKLGEIQHWHSWMNILCIGLQEGVSEFERRNLKTSLSLQIVNILWSQVLWYSLDVAGKG
jgi:hypothetical protein